MSDSGDVAAVSSDLLRGAEEIAAEIYGDTSPTAVRRIYHEQARWPVFKLDSSGVLYALRSRIRQHLETMSANKEAAIATAQVAAQESKPLRRRRRRARASAAV